MPRSDVSTESSATASADNGAGTPPSNALPPASRRPWVLLGLTALGVVFTIQSGLGTWLTVQATVSGVQDTYHQFGVAYFGSPGWTYLAGNVLAAVLLGLAWWRSGRWRTWLSVAAFLMCCLTLIDLVSVLHRLDSVEAAYAAEVVRLRESVEGLPSYVALRFRTPGLVAAVLATLLYALVSVQLAWARYGIRIQAVAGGLLCVVAAVMPWMRLWVIDDERSAEKAYREYFWLWSNAYECAGVVIGLAVLAWLVYRGMRAPGYARHGWAIGAVLVALAVFLSVQLIDIENGSRAYDLSKQVSEVLGSTSTGAATLAAIGTVLLTTAVVRSWWHGREEVPPAESSGSWLPAGIRRD